MKKLMLMAVMMSVGFSALAVSSTVTWITSGVHGYNTANLYSGSATLYVSYYNSWTNKKVGDVSYTFSMANGVINTSHQFSIDAVTDITDLTKAIAYYEMTDSAGNTYASGSKQELSGYGLSTVTFDFGSNGYWTENPNPQPTPEPTSGMLMLLGLAGMALKRKRV